MVAEASPTPTALLASPDRFLRQRVAAELESLGQATIVGLTRDGLHALHGIRRLRPHAALLDLDLPGLDGRAVLRAVLRDALPTRVVLLVPGGTGPVSAIRGAAACLARDTDHATISQTLLAAAIGRIGADPSDRSSRRVQLTPRELEVLRFAVEGGSGPAIAEALCVGTETVKSHFKSIYAKLGVNTRAAAVAEALRQGLVD